ncbi:MAG: shikimate dehydrogenase [Brevinematia bacterium]
MITSSSNIFCVIGNPIKHSKSPVIHNFIFNILGIDAVYVAFEVKDLETFFKFMRDVGISGVSITIPHKVESLKHVDWVDEVAKKIGAINTIKNEQGYLKGFNTDVEGILKAFEVRGITSLKGKFSLVLGTGGVARSTIHSLILLGVEKIVIAGRTLDKLSYLVEEVRSFFKNVDGVSFDKVGELIKVGVDVVANCTPLGMFPEVQVAPIDLSLINSNHIVFDTIYTPIETRLIKVAKEVGAKVIYGIDMFVFQALAQQKIWLNREDVFVLKDEVIDLLNGFR